MRKDKDATLTDKDRLEGVLKLLDELEDLSEDHVFLIEGKKDRYALNALGLYADMFQVQSGGGPVNAVQYVEEHSGKAVILTDWDRRGDSLAEQLKELLGANGDVSIRSGLIRFCKSDIKDMESLHTFVRRMQSELLQ